MKALVFAAGRGERLKPLTDHTPKPLVKVRGKTLIQYHIEALLEAGIHDIIINVSWLHQQIIDHVNELAKQPAFTSLKFQFSIESDGPLETGGGMLKALPLIQAKQQPDDSFLVLNADVFTDLNYADIKPLEPNQLINLIMVKNPTHNPNGDFGLDLTHDNLGLLSLKNSNQPHYTYAGIGLYRPQILFPAHEQSVFKLKPYLLAAIQQQRAMGQLYDGQWHDVGTIERLDELNRME